MKITEIHDTNELFSINFRGNKIRRNYSTGFFRSKCTVIKSNLEWCQALCNTAALKKHWVTGNNLYNVWLFTINHEFAANFIGKSEFRESVPFTRPWLPFDICFTKEVFLTESNISLLRYTFSQYIIWTNQLLVFCIQK